MKQEYRVWNYLESEMTIDGNWVSHNHKMFTANKRTNQNHSCRDIMLMFLTDNQAPSNFLLEMGVSLRVEHTRDDNLRESRFAIIAEMTPNENRLWEEHRFLQKLQA